MSQETLSYHCSLVEDALLTMQKSNTVKRIVAELTLVRMCEPRLAGSTQAMLDRISELEQKIKNISSGVVVASPEVVEEKPDTPKTKTRRAPVFTDDDDIFKSDAPPAAKTPASPKKTEIGAQKRVLKSFKNRAEILEKLNSIDPMNASFFSDSKWYTDEEGRIVLKFASAYSIDTIKIFNGDTQMYNVLSSTLGGKYNKDNVLFECDENKKGNSAIDEILLNSED